MMRVLLCGFEPFGGESVNPALEAVRLVPEGLAGMEITKLTVPTVFGTAMDVVAAEVARLRPDAVLCVGQAGGRAAVTVERVAINVDDARIADNGGDIPVDRPIVPGGPAAYFATVPVKAMVAAIRAEGLPGEISNSAGTFVCNHLLYGVLHLAHTTCPAMVAGFVHVPFLPAQVTERVAPSMSLDHIVSALCAALGAMGRQSKECVAT